MPVYDHNNAYRVTSLVLPVVNPEVHPGFPSGGGAIGDSVWVITASSISSAYGNGLTYTPLVQGAADTIEIEFISSITGDMELELLYAMSAANTGDVELQLDYLATGDGDDPTTAITTQAAFTVTPGNDALVHTVDSTSDATMAITVTEGDSVYLKLTRPTGGGDTHTGDMRLIRVRGKAV